MMLAVGFCRYRTFCRYLYVFVDTEHFVDTRLRKFSFNPSLFSGFFFFKSWNGHVFRQSLFSHLQKWSFCLKNDLLIKYITLINFQMIYQPCIPGISPIGYGVYHPFIMLLDSVCLWFFFFASIFMRNIWFVVFFFLVMSLCGFSIRVLLPS